MPKLKQSQTEIQNNSFRAAIANGMALENITMQELADAIHVSQPTLRKHRRNPELCGIGEFRRMCQKLHFTGAQVCAILGVKLDS